MTGRVSQMGRLCGMVVSQRLERDNEFTVPVTCRSWDGSAGLVKGPWALSSGDLPAPVLDEEAEGQQASKVEGGNAVMSQTLFLATPRYGTRRLPRVSQAMLRSTRARFAR